jgi:hypothetical protein
LSAGPVAEFNDVETPAVNATEVPVAAPKIGVTSVGVLAKTAAPVPVSSVNSAMRLADDGVAANVSKPEARTTAAHEVSLVARGW